MAQKRARITTCDNPNCGAAIASDYLVTDYEPLPDDWLKVQTVPVDSKALDLCPSCSSYFKRVMTELFGENTPDVWREPTGENYE